MSDGCFRVKFKPELLNYIDVCDQLAGSRPRQDCVHLQLQQLRPHLQLPLQLQEAPGHALGRGGTTGLQDMQNDVVKPGEVKIVNINPNLHSIASRNNE